MIVFSQVCTENMGEIRFYIKICVIDWVGRCQAEHMWPAIRLAELWAYSQIVVQWFNDQYS